MKKSYILKVLICFLVLSNESLYSVDKWHIEEGWAYRNGEKFFPIGIWGIPDYDFKLFKVDEDMENIRLFKEIGDIFNLVYVQYGREQEYMKNSLLFTGYGHFMWKMKEGYCGPSSYNPDKNGDKKINLNEMQFIKDNLIKHYSGYIYKEVVIDINKRFYNYNHIWFLADEPNTGFADWVWYPEIVKTYNDAVKKTTDSTLTFIDLFGSIKGDRYAYEQNYRKMYGKKLEILPEGTKQELLQGDPLQLSSYNYSADGTPVYRYNLNRNRWEFNDVEKYKDKFYYNIFSTATIYGMCADVLGVNCYQDYFNFPSSAGLTIDAIKDACGNEKPVWLFFDGAAHAKPQFTSEKEYLKNVRCQIFTSIVHGASGVLFWSKKDVAETYWNLMKELALELKYNAEIIKGIEIEEGKENNIIFSIRKISTGESYIIAVNTSKRSSNQLHFSDLKLMLNPLEVIIKKY